MQLCTEKIHVVNYGYNVTQSHSYFQVHLLGLLKCLYVTSLFVITVIRAGGFTSLLCITMNRRGELIMLSPQVHGVRIIADLR